MSEAWTRANDAGRPSSADAAADWVVRLQSDGVTESDAEAFDVWLSASPDNARAYDRALAVMLELEGAADGILQALREGPAPSPVRRSSSRGWLIAGGFAAAATVALAVAPFGALAPAAAQTFATGKGEHRMVKLADGSAIEMNGGSNLSVTLGRHERRVVMPEGEAVFDVAADKARPFLIVAGDRTVRVVGTRFDVRHRGNQLAVTVERGVVEVIPNEGVAGQAFRLHPGQRLDSVEGAPAAQLTVADPQQVESWRTGRLIYRDQPLADVVTDLNQQYPRQIVIGDAALAQTRVSGVLVLDDQDAVIRRLALLAPIKALPSAQGVTLRIDPVAKP